MLSECEANGPTQWRNSFECTVSYELMTIRSPAVLVFAPLFRFQLIFAFVLQFFLSLRTRALQFYMCLTKAKDVVAAFDVQSNKAKLKWQ